MDYNITKNFLKEYSRMCQNIECKKCDFYNTRCSKCRAIWFFQEEVKKAISIVQEWSDNNPLEIDWLKVPINTKVLVRDEDSEEWEEQYFMGYLNGAGKYKYVAFCDGERQETATNVWTWAQCKLADDVDPTPYAKE